MSTALTVVPVDDLVNLAEKLAPSTLLPSALRGKVSDVLCIVMAGRELGLAPMASLRCLNVIEGKAVLNADGMVGVVRGSGKCIAFDMIESSPTIATFETQRVGGKVQRLSFTIEQAKAAKLTGKSNWQSYPDAMLRARAQSALCRLVYQDVLAGVYSDDEASEFSRQDRQPSNVREFRAPETIIDVVEDPLVTRLQDAGTLDELQMLVPELSRLADPSAKSGLRKIYAARKKELASAETPRTDAEIPAEAVG